MEVKSLERCLSDGTTVTLFYRAGVEELIEMPAATNVPEPTDDYSYNWIVRAKSYQPTFRGIPIKWMDQ